MISQQEVDNATAAVADAEAQVHAAEAQLQEASLNLGYTTVHSPISGVAGLALVRVGNLVGQDGPTLLTTVSQLDPVRVNFPLNELDYVRYPDRFAHLEARDLAWAKQELTRLDAHPELSGVELILADASVYPHRGVIVAVNRQIDANTGTTQLQALVSNPDGILRPGEYARVRIRRENEGKNVVVVPEKALVSVQGTFSAAVVGPDNKISMTIGSSSARACRDMAWTRAGSSAASGSSSSDCSASATARRSIHIRWRRLARAPARQPQRGRTDVRVLHPAPDRGDGDRDRDRADRAKQVSSCSACRSRSSRRSCRRRST